MENIGSRACSQSRSPNPVIITGCGTRNALVASPLAESPNAFIYSTYLGPAVLAIGVLVLGVGLLMRGPAPK